VRINYASRPGFRTDYDDYSKEEISRDPFYQEYLRPMGLLWHANARLNYDGNEELEISFKRELKLGPFVHEDVVSLDAILPDLKAAMRIAHRVLDAEAGGMVHLLQRRGDTVFELDFWGRVLRAHGHLDSDGEPLRLLRRRLVAADGLSQAVLDRAIVTAVRSPQEAAIASLSGCDGERYFLQFIPVSGRARDVFLAASAVAVLIKRPQRARVDLRSPLIRDLFALSDREMEVAIMLVDGWPPMQIARRLGVQIGTARYHLKSIFEKTGTNRQAELVGLLAKLMP
jgi:DNA-binding CsgD family transcriptional regulator